jgi:hypothetical protein|tara:strand:+ start:291 stop:908 length:618 start_codon:yes stop_codon:yes gene_type:complete
MNIQIKLEPTFSIKWPNLRYTINNKIIFDGECKPNNEKYHVIDTDITDFIEKQNQIIIEHYDKSGRETLVDSNGDIISDRALILRSIRIDDSHIPEVILHDKPFKINWTDEQLKETKDRPEYIKDNLYFGYNGVYKFTFSNNSAREHFINLLEKERIANVRNKKEIVRPDGKTVEAFEFTGTLVDSNESETVTIEQLYNRINDED